MSELIDEATLITHCQRLLTMGRRTFLAIAGAPGSGKSTLVERVAEAMAVQGDDDPLVAILPMDGYHYDDSILKARGRHQWKGAPDTFDVSGLRSTLVRLADPAEGSVAVPVFDRELEISRGSARIIAQSVQLILVEGNYLLLDENPGARCVPCLISRLLLTCPKKNSLGDCASDGYTTVWMNPRSPASLRTTICLTEEPYVKKASLWIIDSFNPNRGWSNSGNLDSGSQNRGSRNSEQEGRLSLTRRSRTFLMLTAIHILARKLACYKIVFYIALSLALLSGATRADTLDRDTLATKVEPPNELGEKLTDKGVWSILDRTGKEAGYIFETEPLAPLPGFSGAPINVLVTLDRDGKFLRAELLEHNEPIFVSGLGEAPFHEFVRQYNGLSIFDSITVGVPYGTGAQDGSGQVYLDGVTKATASVRIAHESILAASLAVARERMQGLAGGPSPSPKREAGPELDWNALVEEGIAKHVTITNAELQSAFAGTLWEDDDAEALAEPQGDYLDLWVIDIGPDAIAQAVLDNETQAARDELLSVATFAEPLLLLANGRHGLVSEEFVRNTAPDLLLAEQGGLPIALRHADIEVQTAEGVPNFEHRLMLRTDRRLGFNPTQDWDLIIRAIRRHGSFMPEVGVQEFRTTQSTPVSFFDVPTVAVPRPVWVESALGRRIDLAILGVFLFLLTGVLLFRQSFIAAAHALRPYRLGILAFTLTSWAGGGRDSFPL